MRQGHRPQKRKDTMRTPSVECYYDYKGDNYGIHALKFGDQQGRQWYFSYRTLVAFYSQKTGLVCLKNYWQATTGKHLNSIQPDHRKRVDQETFDAMLILAESSQ